MLPSVQSLLGTSQHSPSAVSNTVLPPNTPALESRLEFCGYGAPLAHNPIAPYSQIQWIASPGAYVPHTVPIQTTHKLNSEPVVYPFLGCNYSVPHLVPVNKIPIARQVEQNPRNVALSKEPYAQGSLQEFLADKRRRNAYASARFRSRRKQRELEIIERCELLVKQVATLEESGVRLKRELEECKMHVERERERSRVLEKELSLLETLSENLKTLRNPNKKRRRHAYASPTLSDSGIGKWESTDKTVCEEN